MSRERTRRRHQAGFTLIEILVALVVLGLVIAGLGQGVRVGLKVWNKQSAMVADVSELDALDRTLRTLLTTATTGLTHGRVGFRGEADRLTVDGILPRSAAPANRLAMLELFVDESHRLTLRWTPHLADAATGERRADQIVLLPGVERIQLQYWHPPGPAGDGAWSDDWTLNAMPGLIRIHLEFGRDTQRRWPDIVIAPRIDEGLG